MLEWDAAVDAAVSPLLRRLPLLPTHVKLPASHHFVGRVSLTTLFVIAFVGRQGSSYLEGLLNSHPDAQCLGEILTPATIPESVASFVERQVRRPDKIASGFKLALQHMDAHPEVISLLQDQKYKAIHLTRENKLDQYVSVLLATANKSWRSDFGEYNIHSVKVDPREFVNYSLAFTRDDVAVRERIKAIPVLPMTYEALLSGVWKVPVLDFLGLKNADLVSPFKRQRLKSQRESIENYDELLGQFAGTEYEHYFTDAQHPA